MFQAPSAGRRTLVLMALDANVPVLVFAGYGLLRHGNPLSVLLGAPWLLLTVLAVPAMLAIGELYTLRPSLWTLAGLARSVAVTLAVVLVFGAAYYFAVDRGTVWELFPALALAMVAEVLLVRSVGAVKARRERSVRTALVVGGGWAGRTVIDCTLREPRLRVKVAGVIDDDPLKRQEQYKGVPVLGTGGALLEAVARNGVSLVVVAVDNARSVELVRNLARLKMRGLEVVDMPGFCERATGQIPIRGEDSWFLYRDGFALFPRRLPRRLKRTFDVVVSALGLVLALPLMGLLALLVKLDSRGPVFSRQERSGRDEKPFAVITFRTMRQDPGRPGGAAWTAVRDCRVTRVGRWLRLLRLNEVPQLINVLKGEMSFVGPRPERPVSVEQLKKEIPYYPLRFSVRPGLTGWAQVQFRDGSSADDAMEKLKYDLYYIKNMSAGLDLWIACKTLKIVLFAKGH